MKRYIRASIPDKHTAGELLEMMPSHIRGAVALLSYPIGKEKCGFTSSLADAEDFIISRTANNRHSKWHISKSPDALNLIHDLFDWLEANSITVAELVTLANLDWQRWRLYISDEQLHQMFRDTRNKYDICA